VLRKDGRYVWVEVCTIPVYGDDGRLVAVEYAIHDIDAWKQAEAALIEANRKLSLMNSIVRHDILNQVTVVLGYIALLRDQPLDPDVAEALDKQQAAAEIIQSQIEFTRDYQDLGVRSPRWFLVAAPDYVGGTGTQAGRDPDRQRTRRGFLSTPIRSSRPSSTTSWRTPCGTGRP
jgi:hypothetical protein